MTHGTSHKQYQKSDENERYLGAIMVVLIEGESDASFIGKY